MSFTPLLRRSDIATRTREMSALPPFPRHGVVGLALMLVGWVGAWLPSHPLSAGSFILLWVGFIFLIDGLVFWRRGASIWSTHPWKFGQLFLFSVPFWWVFEALNLRVQNWHYLTDHPFGYAWNGLSYNIVATLCFSTVLPAVMEVAALITSFAPLRPTIAAQQTVPTPPRRWLYLEFALGIITLIAPLLWPHQAFGLIWLGPLLLLDSTNAFLGRRSAISHLVAGDWRFIAAIALSALICGFFWEMWNFWSLPKWYYTVPYVGFAKVFEMPILGFSGYLPFGLELFAMYQFLLWATRQRDDALPF